MATHQRHQVDKCGYRIILIYILEVNAIGAIVRVSERVNGMNGYGEVIPFGIVRRTRTCPYQNDKRPVVGMQIKFNRNGILI